MVICTYFLNNTCRFGAKCHNEHVNVKLTLKTDAEGALKGNQWPLTCYGPFRDKPSVPNFIEDQSFEEARHLCYEAKATGNVQMVMNQFAQSVLDAKNKMNMLTNPSDDVVTMVTNLYNSTCTANAPTSNANTNVNSFGMSGGGMNSTTASSIFGGGAGAAVGNTATNANLFGSASAATASNPFARNTGAFGMPQQNQTTSTNLFGASSTPANAVNPFGGVAQSGTNTAGSLFGGSSFANTGSSAFGGSTGQTASLFGGGGAPSGPFSQPSMGSSPFAQSNQATSVFGGAATFGQPKPTGLFGQANAALGQTTNAGNIFGQSVQNSGFGAPATTALAQTNFFGGGGTQASSQSIFGGQQNAQSQDNPFAAVAQSGTNIFGNAQQQQQQQQPPPSFQSSTSSMFGGGSGNLYGIASGNGNSQSAFGAQMTNQTTVTAAPSLQQQQQSIFGTNSFSTSAPVAPIPNSPFGSGGFQNQQQQQQQQQTQTQSIFGSSIATDQAAAMQPNSNPFGAQPQQYQQQQQQQSGQQLSNTKLYTPMDLLDPDELEAFKADTFDINKIPTKPPPMELCI